MRLNGFIASVVFATAFVAGTALVSNSARADTVLFDNLNALSSGTDPALAPNSGVGPLYDSFSTGASDFSLNQIKLMVSGNSGDGGTFNVSIYADSSTSPGSVLLSLGKISDSILPTSLNVVDINFAPYPLTANKRYWIGISSTDSLVPTSIAWSWSLDTSGIGVAAEYFANSKGVFPNTGGPYNMELLDATTPLPSSWIMMLTGLAGFGFLAAYRRRKNAVALAAA